jgi:hypothetical protein
MVGFQKPDLQYGTYYSSAPNGPGSNVRRLVVVGVIIAVILGIVLFLLTNLGGSPKNDLTLLAVHENSLLQLADTSQKSIRNADLSTINSNTTILLASDVATLVKATGIKKLPADLVKQEADTNGDKLKEAALLDKFDPTYRQIVLDKVTSLTDEAQKLRSATSSKSTRATLDQLLTNLDSINKQFVQLEL